MKKSNLLWMGVLLMVAVACSKSDEMEEIANDPETPEVPVEPTVVEPKTRVDIVMTPQESVVNDAANQFSLKFFDQMVRDPEAGPNIFVSPFSAQAALSMTANGARNVTLDEMLAALNMKGFGLDDINQYNQTIIKAITDLDNTTFVESANGIWSKVNMLESFSSTVQAVYDAKAEQIDASRGDREAIIAINNWANEKTHGMIPELYSENEELGEVVLANALYFNGVWTDPFLKEATEKGTFTNADKSVSSLDMMNKGGYMRFADCGTFDLCEKPYGNGAFSMVFLLPHQDVALSQCISDLAQKDWNTLTATLAKQSSRVLLTVPKFELKDLKYDLKPTLQAMGMEVPFTGAADFRNMSNTDLFIRKADQLTALTLNEQGTQAAAITKIEMRLTSDGTKFIDFTLNRPFAFLIKEKSTGVILFAGAVTQL